MAFTVEFALVFRFLRDVVRHWGSLVTSGAIIGAISIWQATGHHVPGSVYWAIAIVGLFIAFYRAWNVERAAKEKAVAGKTEAEAVAAHAPKSRDWNTEWKECGDRFKGYATSFVRADWSRSALRNEETWNTAGDPAVGNHLRSLCRLTGEMLLASPAVARALPSEIRSQPNPIDRWFLFLKARGELKQMNYAWEVMNDGTKHALVMGCIPNLADASERACIECAATEFQIMRQ